MSGIGVGRRCGGSLARLLSNASAAARKKKKPPAYRRFSKSQSRISCVLQRPPGAKKPSQEDKPNKVACKKLGYGDNGQRRHYQFNADYRTFFQQ
jgi:hypothetical protein